LRVREHAIFLDERAQRLYVLTRDRSDVVAVQCGEGSARCAGIPDHVEGRHREMGKDTATRVAASS
jgi:hypothetical protein